MLCTRNILVYFVSFIAIFAKNIKVTWFAKASAKNTTTQFHLNSKAPFNRCAFFPFLFMVMVCVCVCVLCCTREEEENEKEALFSLSFSLSIYHYSYGMTVDIGRHNVYTKTKLNEEKKTLEKQTATGSLYKSV